MSHALILERSSDTACKYLHISTFSHLEAHIHAYILTTSDDFHAIRQLADHPDDSAGANKPRTNLECSVENPQTYAFFSVAAWMAERVFVGGDTYTFENGYSVLYRFYKRGLDRY